jgi:hypothetical protein
MGGRPGAFARPVVFSRAIEEHGPMKQNDRDEGDDRELPSLGWEERIEAAYLRIKAGLPPVPWLPNLPR